MPLLKTLLILGKGQMGQAFYDYFSAKPEWNTRLAGIPEVDIRDISAVECLVNEAKPDILINTAALTNLDWCEDHPLETLAVNTLGADKVAHVCQKNDIYLVHISSGCIQESAKANEAHGEDDPPNPLSFYSWTKVWADQLLTERLRHHGMSSDLPAPLKALIVRPRQILSARLSPRNALAKMLTYTKFVDTPNSCTLLEDMIPALEALIKKNTMGVYNLVNPGVTTPYELALLLKKIVKPDLIIQKISKEELNRMTHAKRIDSVLSTAKLNALGIALPEIHERLKSLLQELKQNLAAPGASQILRNIQEETEAKLKNSSPCPQYLSCAPGQSSANPGYENDYHQAPNRKKTE